MPFTPFHMGPGMLIKAAAGRHFSVLSFGIAQVAMDIEPLLGMLLDWDRLHGPTHTYAGALMIGLAVSFIAPPLCRPLLRRFNAELAHYRLEWLSPGDGMDRRPAIDVAGVDVPVLTGAFAGTLSHVALDSIMHADLQPFAPWSQANAWLGLISIPALYQWCAAAGAAGLMSWLVAGWRRRRAGRVDATGPMQ